jgi:hypothetical protein
MVTAACFHTRWTSVITITCMLTPERTTSRVLLHWNVLIYSLSLPKLVLKIWSRYFFALAGITEVFSCHMISHHQYATTCWNVLRCFGYPDLVEELAGVKTHSLENILMLEHNVHNRFDTLKLGLERDDPVCP